VERARPARSIYRWLQRPEIVPILLVSEKTVLAK